MLELRAGIAHNSNPVNILTQHNGVIIMAKAAADTKASTTKVAKEKPVIERDAQNGVTRPKAGTQTGNVWAISDKLSTNEAPAGRKEVLAEAIAKGINGSTAATQYGRWRKYHGLQGTGKAVAAAK